MISDRFRCIFIEVPKTGSTSIRQIIGHPHKPHLNICQIQGMTDPERFSAYFKFGFVRNPWDRLVSLYERKEGLQVKAHMSFEEFIDWAKFASCTCIHPLPHRYQFDWFVDPHGNMLMDFVGRFERLEQDWATICSRLGITQPLPHANANPRAKHYTEYYSTRTRDVVAERFKVDIEYFQYEFGR